MMVDIDARARAAGAAAREEARVWRERVPTPGAPRSVARPRLLVAASAGVGIVLVVTVVVVGVMGGPPSLTIDPVAPPVGQDERSVPTEPADRLTGPVAEDGVLPVPEVGDAIAAHLDDGTPVFVAQPAAGEVLVLDAVNPDPTWGIGKLVSYCPSSGWFEDQIYGSRFNGWGDYTGGPAPTGLATYPTDLADDGSTVRVTGDRRPPTDRDQPREPGQSPRGPGCGPEGSGAPTAVLHEPPHPPPMLDGTDIPTDRWTWAEVLVAGTGDAPVVCDVDGSCPPVAPPLSVELGLPASSLFDREPTRYLVRADENGGVELLLPGDPAEDGPLEKLTSWSEELLYAVPARGEVVATYLDDSTPVFLSHAPDGEVHVLDASSPDRPGDLAAWCPSTDRFVDRTSTYIHDGTPAGGPSTRGLPRYLTEFGSVGDREGIRLTGRIDHVPTASPGSSYEHDGAELDCADDYVAHAPTFHQVAEPEGTLDDENWMWVRMAVEHIESLADIEDVQNLGFIEEFMTARQDVVRVEDQTFLCAMHPRYVPACGLPSTEHFSPCPPHHAPEEDPDRQLPGCGGPMQDPVVTTEGVEPTDGPALLLVLGSSDNRTVEVRRPVVVLSTD